MLIELLFTSIISDPPFSLAQSHPLYQPWSPMQPMYNKNPSTYLYYFYFTHLPILMYTCCSIARPLGLHYNISPPVSPSVRGQLV